MSPVRTAAEVLEAIQKVKAGATAFCTNFFPVQSKLESWVAHGELAAEAYDGVTIFLRKDRDFSHLYFCASNPSAFGRELGRLSAIATGKLAIDLVGPEASLAQLLNLAQQGGFHPYSRLVRLARVAASGTSPADQSAATIELAAEGDASEILGLIELLFDRFADQLPTSYEIEAAIAARQIFIIRQNGAVAALLFFETQGLTSTIRYWLVASQFHSRGFGSALIRHYFMTQPAVRRFLLWVTATNENAIQKYQHYGYKPDGLVDHVLLSEPVKN
jgi:ribosomal protein S18 acetylase RimI-like enzyme